MTFSNDVFKKKEGKTDPELTFQQDFTSEFCAMKWMHWSLHNVKAVKQLLSYPEKNNMKRKCCTVKEKL